MHATLKKNKTRVPRGFGWDFDSSAKEIPLKHALVADDDHALCKFLTMALEIIGFKVQTAKDGKEAYDLFLENQYDLVITDFQMPVMNGFSLIRKIKTRSPCIPIILISGTPLDDLSTIGGRCAVEGVLNKPFSLTELHQAALQATARHST